MRIKTCAALLCAVASVPFAAIAEPVALPFAPSVGATWSIVQTRTITTNQPGKPPSSKGEVKASLTVVGETDEGYVMEWTTESVSSGGVIVRNQPDLLIGIPLRFDTDASGIPVSLHNSSALLDKLVSAVGSDPVAAARTRQFYNAMDAEALASRLLQEASVIGQCQNFELDPDEPIEAEMETPNSLGGLPILTTVLIRLEHAGSASEPARIVIRQSFDPESAAASVLESMKALAGEGATDKLLQDGKMPPMRRDSVVTCHVDVATGAAVGIISDTDTETQGQQRRDVRKFTIRQVK